MATSDVTTGKVVHLKLGAVRILTKIVAWDRKISCRHFFELR